MIKKRWNLEEMKIRVNNLKKVIEVIDNTIYRYNNVYDKVEFVKLFE